MSLQENKPETVASLLRNIDDVIHGVAHIGGSHALNAYGQGQYDMMKRMKRKLENIKKASEDALSDGNTLES